MNHSAAFGGYYQRSVLGSASQDARAEREKRGHRRGNASSSNTGAADRGASSCLRTVALPVPSLHGPPGPSSDSRQPCRTDGRELQEGKPGQHRLSIFTSAGGSLDLVMGPAPPARLPGAARPGCERAVTRRWPAGQCRLQPGSAGPTQQGCLRSTPSRLLAPGLLSSHMGGGEWGGGLWNPFATSGDGPSTVVTSRVSSRVQSKRQVRAGAPPSQALLPAGWRGAGSQGLETRVLSPEAAPTWAALVDSLQ